MKGRYRLVLRERSVDGREIRRGYEDATDVWSETEEMLSWCVNTEWDEVDHVVESCLIP